MPRSLIAPLRRAGAPLVFVLTLALVGVPVALGQEPPPPTTQPTDTSPTTTTPTSTEPLPPPAPLLPPPPGYPKTGVSQYVEQVPTASGPQNLERPATGQRKPTVRVRRQIQRKGGKDKDALTRLVTPPQTPPPPPPPADGSPPPPPPPPAPVEEEQRELVREQDPPPVSGDSLAAAATAVGDGTNARVIALVVVLGLLTLFAAAVALRRRSPHRRL